MRLNLPYPHKHLWPNGSRGHPRAVDREKAKHKEWAQWAAKKANAPVIGDGPIPVRLIVQANRFGPLPDRDNCIAAMKMYLDGIAAELGINDCNFAAPTVEFSDERVSRFVIEIGHG